MTADVKELRVWQHAVDLCEALYVTTRGFPSSEQFGLTAQMRRAAVSVPSNLAEGYGRGGRKDYRQFVRIARGSAFELETQVVLAERLGFLNAESASDLATRIQDVLKMLSGLVRSLSDS
jgi:four helix bundle protein